MIYYRLVDNRLRPVARWETKKKNPTAEDFAAIGAYPRENVVRPAIPEYGYRNVPNYAVVDGKWRITWTVEKRPEVTQEVATAYAARRTLMATPPPSEMTKLTEFEKDELLKTVLTALHVGLGVANE